MDIALSFSLLGLMIYLIASMSGVGQRDAGQSAQLRRLDRKVDAIVEHLGIKVVDDADPKVLELLIAGKKIEAIKLYREQSGADLKEAKDYVESL